MEKRSQAMSQDNIYLIMAYMHILTDNKTQSIRDSLKIDLPVFVNIMLVAED